MWRSGHDTGINNRRAHWSRVTAQYSAANLKQEIGKVLGCEPARVVITYVLIPTGEPTTMSVEEDKTAQGPVSRRNREQFLNQVLNDHLDFAEGLQDAASRVWYSLRKATVTEL